MEQIPIFPPEPKLVGCLKVGSAVILAPVELFALGETCAVKLLVWLAVLAHPLKECQWLAAFFAHKVSHFSRLLGYRPAVHIVVLCATFLFWSRAGKEVILVCLDMLERLTTLLANEVRHCRD